MIRPLRDEVERYGHYSLAAESMYDHPFQWGSKRTGPDLARVGGKYSDGWHARPPDRPALGGAGIDDAALRFPGRAATSTTATSPTSCAPCRRSGVPYTEDMIAHAADDLLAQARPDGDGRRRSCSRAIPRRQCATSPAAPGRITEMDALIAYLQMLGTCVDFSTYHADGPNNR